MRYMVTGAAGFIGSHITQKLLEEGHEVIGIDCFTDYYAKEVKEDRVKPLMDYDRMEFVRGDILELDLRPLLDGVDVVFHEAAQPGVRSGWGKDFNLYVDNNINATQRLLDALKECDVKRVVYASSSSVYGDALQLPTSEEAPLMPLSPYGVTKVAGEKLCNLYWKNFGVPVVILRYFTVFGPKPRPDMAFCIFIRAILEGKTLRVNGDGEQSRGFTYVSDVVDANIRASEADCTGEVFNIGGGDSITLKKMIEVLMEVIGKRTDVEYEESQRGEARHTLADISKARRMLGFVPKVDFKGGAILSIPSVKEFYRL